MKTLFLLRHAKSSWDDPALNDFDRPLNQRGREAAPMMGRVMNKKNLAPEIIVCSTAERARQTAALVKEAGRLEGILKFEDMIYAASASELLQVVAGLDDEFESAMLVGHNPGFESAVRVLSGAHETMPTAALAVLELEISDWAGVAPGCGKLVEVLRPKEVN